MTGVAPKIDTVILDFDGTIADSADVSLETLAEVLHRPPFTSEQITDFHTLPTRTSMKNLGIKTWQLPYLLMRGRRITATKMDQVEIFEGMPEAIRQLDEEDYGLYVLSTNSLKNITNLLDRNGLGGNITGIRAGAGMFNKAKRLAALMKRESLIAEQCVYVGDEVRDIEAARRVGLKCLAVGWGFHAPQALAANHPDALVAAPTDLVGAVQAL
jgi:phosphoglycolate phosphatase